MKLKVLWMYHDMMDLYGDRGNIQVLKQRCIKRGIDIVVDTCGMHEEADIKAYHLVFIGGGADQEQRILASDLVKRKTQIEEAIKQHTFFLLICGGYQFFGQYYLDGNGNKIEGLNIASYYTESGDKQHRCIGNVAVEVTLDNETFSVVGFENHGGQTQAVSKPFAKVIQGHGNIWSGQFEGYYDGSILGTYLHGPLLPKNPKLADFIIKRALSKEYPNVELQPLDDTLENQAQAKILERMKVNKAHVK